MNIVLWVLQILLCALGLALPLLVTRIRICAPTVASLVIATEMLVFCGLHQASGDGSTVPLVYWLVVAALCGVIAFGRLPARSE